MYNGNRVALIEDAVDVADAVLIPFISFEAMMDIANACHLWRITVFPQPPIQREIDHFAHAIQRPNRLIWFLLLLFVSVIQHSIEFHFHFWSIPSDWVSNNKKKKKNKSKKYQMLAVYAPAQQFQILARDSGHFGRFRLETLAYSSQEFNHRMPSMLYRHRSHL